MASDDLEWMSDLYTVELPEPSKAQGAPRRFTKVEIRKVYLLASEGATQAQIAREIDCDPRTLRRLFKRESKKVSRDRELVREAYERGHNHYKTYGQSNLTESIKVLTKLRKEMMMSVGDDCLIEDSEVSDKYFELKEEIRRCFESEERQRQIRDWVESRSLFQSDD